MTFLEREYLAFKLRQLQSGDLDFELDNDTDSESDASSSFLSVEDSGSNTSPLASGTPATGGGDKPLLLNQYLAFQKRQRNTRDCLDGGTDCSSSKVRHCTNGYSSLSSSDNNPGICSPDREDNHDGGSPWIAD